MKTEKTTMDDMVFENRNKEYGAYYLRKNYRNHLTRAMLLGAGFFLLVFGSAYTYSNYILPKLENTKIVEYNLKELPKTQEKAIEITPPEPPKEVTPPTMAEEKFLPPEPKIDEQVTLEEPPPSIDALDKAIISDRKVEGVESSDAFVPAPPAAEAKAVAIDDPEEGKVFTAVEQQPEYPGGTNEMYKYLYANIKYPAAAQRVNVGGKVYLRFVVEKDGSIGNVEIIKGIGFGCDEEAARVIKTMPRWNPGRQNGKSVRVFFNMPIVYKLE